MENLYSKFLGLGFQNKIRNKEYKTLTKSSSMPFYSSFQARKLPTNLSGEIHFKKINGGITSSDIKVQMLEEKLKNLEKEHNKMLNTINENKNNNGNENNTNTIPRSNIQPYIMPLPLLLLNNNKDMNNYNSNNNISRTQLLNNELQKSRLKFNKHRGLQKQDYYPNFLRNYSNNINPDYNSIFNRPQNYESKQKEKKYKQELENLHLKKKARKFINKLDKEIYSPIEDDFQNYINNVNKNIQQQLKEDNILLNNEIDKAENEFNEMKQMLKIKLKNMEKRQKSNFDNLINVLSKVGGNKISKAIQNIFEGKNYDLQKAEEEYLANDVFNLPNIIDKKIMEVEKSNNEKEKRIKKQIKQKMHEEYLRQREIEELKQKERLKMLEAQKEKERIDNLRNLNMLRYEFKKEKEEKYNNYINNMNQFFMRNQNLPLSEKYRLFYMEQMKNINGNKGNIPFNISNFTLDDILKYMLLKKMGFDNIMNNMNNMNNYNFQPNNNDNYDMIMNNNRFNKLNNNMNGINNIEEEKKSIIKNDNNNKETFPSIIRKKTEESKKTKSKKSSKKSKKSSSKISSLNIIDNSKKSENKNENKDKNKEINKNNNINENNKKNDKENNTDDSDESEEEEKEEEEEQEEEEEEADDDEEDENKENKDDDNDDDEDDDD